MRGFAMDRLTCFPAGSDGLPQTTAGASSGEP